MEQSNNSIMKLQIKDPIFEPGSLTKLQVANDIKEIEIQFDKEVTFNSIGIREWITWVTPLSRNKDLRIKLFGCPVSMVQQMNLLSGFLPAQAEVVSFYIPFYSDDTDESKWVLVSRGKEIIDKELKVEFPKDSNGKEMEMDVNPKNYFKFIGLNIKEK